MMKNGFVEKNDAGMFAAFRRNVLKPDQINTPARSINTPATIFFEYILGILSID